MPCTPRSGRGSVVTVMTLVPVHPDRDPIEVAESGHGVETTCDFTLMLIKVHPSIRNVGSADQRRG
jgi:hypothetical protein